MALIQAWKNLWQDLPTTPFLNPIILCFLLLFSLLFLYNKLTIFGRLHNSPPSPPRLPIIGNLHQLSSSIHRSLQALSEKYGPLMLLHFGSVPIVVVSSSELAREILKTRETFFINRRQIKSADVFFLGCTDLAFCPYGDYWREARKVSVLELLSPKRVQSFQFVREEEVADILKKIRASCMNRSSINLTKMFVTISSNIVSRTVLGQKCEGENGIERFGEVVREVLELMGAFCFEDMFPYLGWIDNLTGLSTKFKETSELLHSFLDRIIDEHQIRMTTDKNQSDKKDFVDILLHLKENGLLDVDLTRDNLKSLLAGGTYTSAITMEWAMAELAKNPSIMKKVQGEIQRVVGKKSKVEESDLNQMDYLKCVAKEILRLYSGIMIRESTESVTLAGYNIPPKTSVMINTWAIQRDPNSWDRPDEFLPERFVDNPIDLKGQDPRFIPFGSGRRGCPGISYASVQMEYVIANLLYWFDWNLPDGATAQDFDISDVFQLHVRKKTPLFLVPVLHTP